MLNETLVKHPRRLKKVVMICLGLGILGILGSCMLTVQLVGLNAFDENSFWVWMGSSLIANPLCWAGLYGIYRLRRT
jgi:hypothetical protein